MSYSNRILRFGINVISGSKSEKGDPGLPGIGFKLINNDYDLDDKKIYNLDTHVMTVCMTKTIL